MSAPIVADKLGRAFGDRQVVEDLDFAVGEGTIQGLIGPSGSGKTTTVRMLTGILAPTSGAARIFGTDPRRLGTADRLRIGYMPQLGVLYPHLSIAQNLRYAASLYGLRRVRRHIDRVLELLDLSDAHSVPLAAASGGMQRRVALAAALMHEPDVMFLDEPTTGLDPVLRHRLWSHLGELRDQGRTLLVTTQIVSEAAMCDRVALIADGGVLADGRPEDLRRVASGGDVLDLHTEQHVPTWLLAALEKEVEAVVAVDRIGNEGRALRVVVADAESDREAVTAALADHDVTVAVVERFQAPFDDVFVALLEKGRAPVEDAA